MYNSANDKWLNDPTYKASLDSCIEGVQYLLAPATVHHTENIHDMNGVNYHSTSTKQLTEVTENSRAIKDR